MHFHCDSFVKCINVSSAVNCNRVSDVRSTWTKYAYCSCFLVPSAHGNTPGASAAAYVGTWLREPASVVYWLWLLNIQGMSVGNSVLSQSVSVSVCCGDLCRRHFFNTGVHEKTNLRWGWGKGVHRRLKCCKVEFGGGSTVPQCGSLQRSPRPNGWI